MNVKKSKLRNEIFDFISSNPSSEVKDIAAHAGVTKQALYYHIKILTEQKKIAVTDSTIVNGIEKKFYSIASSGKEDQKEGTFDDLKADSLSLPESFLNFDRTLELLLIFESRLLIIFSYLLFS